MKNTSQKYRVSDFESRATYAPGNVVSDPRGRWRYIPVHCFGQDHCDAYWCVENDVCFLQVGCRKTYPNHLPGLFARWSKGSPPILNLVAVVDDDTITRDVFEDAMERFVPIAVTVSPTLSQSLGEKLVRLSYAKKD